MEMSTTKRYRLHPYSWITISFLGLCVSIMSGYLLYDQFIRIQQKPDIFVTKYLQWLSLGSILSGLMFGVFIFLQQIPGLCYISTQLASISMFNQFIFLGFYQLSRLHYTFSKSSSYADKAYPNYVFIGMGSIGIILLIDHVIFVWFQYPIPSICMIDKQFESYWIYTDHDYISRQIIQYNINIAYIIVIMGLCWDITTLLLYACKLRIFGVRYNNKNNDNDMIIYNRILSIMYRIIIITLFYQIFAFIIAIITRSVATIYPTQDIAHLSFIGAGLITSIIWSMSIYLMLSHNTNQYRNFLKYLHCVRFEYIFCCCCISIVKQQLDQFKEVNIGKQMNGKKCLTPSTLWETRGMTDSHIQIVANQINEFSQPTQIANTSDL